MGAGGIGTMIGGVSQMGFGIEQGNADEKASIAQWDRERRQADTAIDMAQEKGAFDSGRLRILNAQNVAKQNVAYANSGVDASQGTAAAVQADTKALGELDAQTASINAAREAWGYKQARTQAKEEYLNRSGNINRQGTGAVLGGMAKWAQGAGQIVGGG